MTDLLHRPLCEISELLRRRELSPVELMRETLARIDSVDARLRAFSALRSSAELEEEAAAAERRLARGEGRPLEGIPLGVKDLEDVAGLATTLGSVPFANRRPARDSVQVARLRDAGAIVVGKTNTPEFGYTAITKNRLFGATHNPWDLERSPGGSSGGSAAAVAAGLVPLATASDGGGSIRLPAAFTGCFGLKVSYGRIPHEPRELWITEDTSVYGPISRTVEDAALHLDTVVGAHPLDPNSLPHPGISYRETLGELPRELRIAFSPDLGHAAVQRDVAEVVAGAARAFEELGHRVEELVGGPPELGVDWGMASAFELLAELAPMIPDHEARFGRAFLRGVKLGSRMTPELWGELRRRREELNRWCAETFERYDLLLTPTAGCDPPPAKGPLPAEIEGRALPWAGVASFTIPFNLSWHPAASVRAGFSKARLPVGLQIVGPRHRDDRVLQAAHAFEQLRPWRDAWPGL